MSIGVTNDVTIYERAGKELLPVGSPKLTVRSHWNRPAFVVLQIGNEEPIAVAAKDLLAALTNSTNTAR